MGVMDALRIWARQPKQPAVDIDRPAQFTVVRARPGYDLQQVDAFLASIPARSAQEINDVEFATSRFGPGYDERQVDAYLDAWIARKRSDGRTG
jgi:DivIVA domain-containing protein